MEYFIIGSLIVFILILLSIIKISVSAKKLNKDTQKSEEQYKSNKPNYSNNWNQKYYTKKKLLTDNELFFYDCFKKLDSKYITFPQINLASIIYKHSSNKYRNELFRNIDFCIFDKDLNILLAIEINDDSHKKNNRISRDKKVKEILKSCNIELLTYNINYPNTQESVIKRTTEILEKK